MRAVLQLLEDSARILSKEHPVSQDQKALLLLNCSNLSPCSLLALLLQLFEEDVPFEALMKIYL